ncbi:MAG TPA: hypothetical protein VHZ96_14880, partial [Frankiaceae bacterium]|nr:hypothetical protein [Frankiaceae bacterium]
MNRSVVLIAFQPSASSEEVGAWFAAANAASGSAGVEATSVSENLPGSVGGGDAVWDLRTEGSLSGIPVVSELLRAPCLAAAEALELDVIASGYRELPGARIK